MPDLFKWQVFCLTENIFVHQWAEAAISTCPNDHNHLVQPESINWVDHMIANQVVIQHEEVKTGGHLQIQCIAFDAPAGMESHNETVVFFPINFMAGYIQLDTGHTGNILSITVEDGDVAGVTTAPVSQTDTVIAVSSTVVARVFVGAQIRLSDGVDTSSYVYVMGINKHENQIIIAWPFDVSFSASGITVQMHMIYADHIELDGSGRFDIGTHTTISAYLPTNTSIWIHYNNKSASMVRVRMNVEFYY